MPDTENDDIDLPIISLSDSTSEGVPAVNESKPAPDPRRAPPSEVRRPATAAPAAPPARPAAAPQNSDPRKSSEVRKPGSVAPAAAPRPAAPAAAAESSEEDPERFLREYADRQKTKVHRLEQQLVELKKVTAERDALRSKSEALAKELGEARKQLEAAAKADDVIKDLQGKVDAALLSGAMATDEIGKLRAKSESLEASIKGAEERAKTAERTLTETIRSLSSQTEGRKDAEARISNALHALQGDGVSKAATVKVPAAEPPAGRPVEKHASAHAAAPRPVINFVKK